MLKYLLSSHSFRKCANFLMVVPSPIMDIIDSILIFVVFSRGQLFILNLSVTPKPEDPSESKLVQIIKDRVYHFKTRLKGPLSVNKNWFYFVRCL